MRIAVLVLGILGVMGPALLGYIWQEEMGKRQKDLDMVKKLGAVTGAHNDPKFREGLKNVDRIIQTTYLLLAAIPLGLFGAVLGYLGRPLSAALLMILPALGPALVAPDEKTKLISIGFSSLLLLGGILAFLVRPPKPKAPREKVEGEEMEEEPPLPAPRKPGEGQEKITKKPAGKPAARKQVVEDDEDEEEEAPRPRRRRKDEEDD